MNARIMRALHELTTGNYGLIRIAGHGVCTKCGQHFAFDVEAEVIDDRTTLGEPDGLTVLCPF